MGGTSLQFQSLGDREQEDFKFLANLGYKKKKSKTL